MSSQSSAAAATGYSQGYQAATAQSNANASHAYSQGYQAGATTAASLSMGQIIMALPSGCISPAVPSGGTYYLCANTWLRPYYGASGLYYKVVTAP
jgi:hypothetical protein